VEAKKHKMRIIYFLAFIGDLTLSMLLVLTVLYATGIGLSTIEVGLIGGAYGFSYLIMPALLGRVSDIISRKISLMIATSNQAIISLLFLFTILQAGDFIFYGLFFGQFSYGIVYGFFWPSIEAYISENTEHSSKEHEKGFANFCISWSMGYAFGPFLAGFFYDFNFLMAFILIFTIYALAFCLVFFKLPYIKLKNNKIQPEKINNSNQNPSYHSNSNKIMVMLLMGVMIYAVISKSLLSYFTNYAALDRGLNWSGTLIGQVIFFFGLGRTVYFFTAQYLKNSFSAITQSFLGIGICLIFLPFFSAPPFIAIIFFITGFFVGRTYLASLELLLKYEQEKKGAKAGIFESIVGIGSSFAPLIAGIIGTIDLRLPYFILSLFVFMFVGIHFFLRKSALLKGYDSKFEKAFT
jgi:MFS family permease